MKILIVDDNPGILNGLKAGLISLGYQVLIAKGGIKCRSYVGLMDQKNRKGESECLKT